MKKISLSIHNILLLFKIQGKEQVASLIFRAFTTIVNIFLPLLLAYYQKNLIQLIEVDSSAENYLLVAVISIAVILLLQKMLGTVFGFANLVINNRMSNRLQYTLYRKCVNAQLFAYDDPEIYEKMTIAQRLGSSTITNYIFSFFDIVSAIAQFISCAILLCSHSYILLLLALLGTIPGIFIRKFSNDYEEFDKKRTALVRRMNYFKQIATQGHYTKETKLFGIIPYICSEHKRYYESWAKTELEYMDQGNRRRLLWQPTTFVFTMILPSFFLIWRASTQDIGVADFSYYLSLLALCHGNLTSIVNSIFDDTLADSRIKDYFDFINMPIDSREGKEVPPQWFDELPEIEFKNVSFCYRGSERNALDNVSFVIKPNEKIAILGLNGAGKTTLIKLLCGLYEPSEGEILIGGYNILEFSQISLYRLFSVVFQDFSNFEMPLSESLSLGRDDIATYDSIQNVFSILDGDNLLENRFSDNIHVPIGKVIDENGLELSGGEHQKIALARSLLQNRAMIILDEPTASLDAYAEAAILEKFVSCIDNKAIVIVTHRLSAVHYVDKIIVIDNAKIIEQGSHEELMKKNGKYAKLYEIQSNEYNS